LFLEIDYRLSIIKGQLELVRISRGLMMSAISKPTACGESWYRALFMQDGDIVAAVLRKKRDFTRWVYVPGIVLDVAERTGRSILSSTVRQPLVNTN